ncbi:MAG: hypothetical protein AAFR66_10530, partial [Bacteroidota bacterium]
MMNSFFLLIHIVAGSLAIIAGFAALLPKKGTKWHKIIGDVFFYSMLVMAGMASYLAVFSSHEPINFLVGLFTIYLIVTSKLAAKDNRGGMSVYVKVLCGISILFFTGYILLLIKAEKSGEAMMDGVYLEAYYIFALLSFIAAMLDVKVVVKGGVKGKQRLARHLWRMLLAMFIATTSLVYGQAQVFPDSIQDSGVL